MIAAAPTLGWLAHGVAAGALLGLAAAAVEPLASLRRRSRLPWLGAGLATVTLSFVALLPGPRRLPSLAAGPGAPVAAAAPGVARTAPAGDPAGPAPGISTGVAALLARPVPGGWGALAGSSLLAAVLLAGAHHSVRRRARRWPRARVRGRRVAVSDGMGPAALGLVHPVVVLPRWALDLPPERLELVLRHETSHVAAGDTRLLASFAALVVLAPWNPALWWIGRRLGLAVETDCDARVAGDGGPAVDYGRLLLELARRGASAPPTPAAAGAGRLLDARIRRLTRRPGRLSAGVGALLSLAFAAGATSVPAPAVAPGAGGPAAGAVVEGSLVGPTAPARPADPAGLRRTIAALARSRAGSGLRGGVALRAWADAGGAVRSMAVDGTSDGTDAASVGAALDLVARVALAAPGGGGAPDGPVALWVVFRDRTVELHLVRPDLYAERGWPGDRADLEHHLGTFARLGHLPWRLANAMAAADRAPGRDAAPGTPTAARISVGPGRAR